jgi:hypothetical protein
MTSAIVTVPRPRHQQSRCEVPLMLPSNSIIAASSTLAASRLELEWLLFAQCYEIILAGRRAADECGIVRG